MTALHLNAVTFSFVGQRPVLQNQSQQTVADDGHDDGRHGDADQFGENRLFEINFQKGCDQGTCPCAGAGKRNAHKQR